MIVNKEIIMKKWQKPRERYNSHKSNAKVRGIEWLFTFETWVKVWVDSGKWEQRGNRKGQYCMARIGDKGPYSPNNVVIKTTEENKKEAYDLGSIKTPNMTGIKWTQSRRTNHTSKSGDPEVRQKISNSLKGHTVSDEARQKMRLAKLGKKRKAA